MPATAQLVRQSLDDPTRLEALYREDPESFRHALEEVQQDGEESVTLRVWAARLTFREPARSLDRNRLWLAIGLALALGALLRFPALWLTEDWYYPRVAPSLAFLALAAYFWREHRDRGRLIAGLSLAAVVTTYASLLPGFTDSVVMALVHLPILCWAFLGATFTGTAWREPDARLRFLRYNGELLILATLVALGFFVFSGITVALFSMIYPDPAEWYAQNIGIFGAAAVPLAATYLYDVVLKRHTGIASVLARVFSPLFLAMTVTYLVVAAVGGKNPFVDRTFLITVNGLLLVVLGMTVLSIAQREAQDEVGWADRINVALLLVTLVIDLVALSAIVFRLTSYGLTPNRVVVLGANLVVMTHLVWTTRAYLALVRGSGAAGEVQRAVVVYLPVYAGWAAVVAFVLPFVFRLA